MRLLGSQLFLVTEASPGLRARRIQLSPAFGGSFVSCGSRRGPTCVARMGPHRLLLLARSTLPHRLGQVQRPWKPRKLCTIQMGAAPLPPLRSNTLLSGSVSEFSPTAGGRPRQLSFRLHSSSPVLFPKM